MPFRYFGNWRISSTDFFLVNRTMIKAPQTAFGNSLVSISEHTTVGDYLWDLNFCRARWHRKADQRCEAVSDRTTTTEGSAEQWSSSSWGLCSARSCRPRRELAG